MAGPLIHSYSAQAWVISKTMITTILSLLCTGLVTFFSWITVSVVTLKTKNDDLIILITSRFDGVEDRLDRIEQKQDKA